MSVWFAQDFRGLAGLSVAVAVGRERADRLIGLRANSGIFAIFGAIRIATPGTADGQSLFFRWSKSAWRRS